MFSSNASQVSNDANYIEDVFSTYLYTGTGAAQTITNNIDLSTKGGMVWAKARFAETHTIYDTSRGASNYLSSDTTAAQINLTTYGLQSFTTTGFTYKGNASAPNTYASWTFRKQPKFFDVVTWTGNGAVRNISHSLGSVPGCIIVKCTTDTGGTNWMVYHRSLSNTEALLLNSTAAKYTGITAWDSTTPTSTVFTVAGEGSVNASGESYVAYIFAHDAAGFGLTGTDNVISCGSYTGNGTTSNTVTLGYEPQFVMVKRSAGGTGAWVMLDTMRGFTVNPGNRRLDANASDAESSLNNTYSQVQPNATGFQLTSSNSESNTSGSTYIYIAIRRGPMKVPTDGTKVFNAATYTGNATARSITGVGFPPDLSIIKDRSNGALASSPGFYDRLRGATKRLYSSGTDAESSVVQSVTGFDLMDGIKIGTDSNVNFNATTFVDWNFKRAPSFFDEVCYVATGSARTVSHNLGVAPELIITKSRTSANQWGVYHVGTGNTKGLYLSSTGVPITSAAFWNNTSPTSSVFTVGSSSATNSPASDNFVSYLFSTCAGVSKVGSYTGTGTTKQIDCGFAAGARFVLIKRTDSTGAWYVWDTARGIVSGNDPYLLLNSQAAEVTSTDYIDTYSAGFELSSTAPAALNASGGSFIFFAVA